MKTKWISQIVTGVALMAALSMASTTMANSAAPATQEQGAGVVVKIDNFSFSPQVLTVAPGTKVTWVNNDDIPHTVVSTTDVFKSKALDTDDKFSFTFDKAGSYDYFCSIHPKMTGKVIVK